MTPDISVVILTYNEEENLGRALDSVCGWARRVFVFDSFSTDDTVKIATARGCVVQQHRFEDFGKQRNLALAQLPIDTEWILFLDADEWLPDNLKDEIATTIARHPQENGFYMKRRFIWMGRWIKHGYYPTWILRLFRSGKARCEERSVNEHMIVEGGTSRLRHDMIHEDRKSVARWIARHNDFATREAEELVRAGTGQMAPSDESPFGPQEQRKRWLRHRIWNRLPPLLRPFGYFSYRYVICGGFLDGREALAYHVLQALWFPLLIDIRYLELTALDSAPLPARQRGG